jgi:serine/threonine protein kinase
MKRIGKYEIRGLLGRGGMSKVFKVAIPVVQKILALKILDPDPLLVQLVGIEKLRELFLSEARKMAGLRHPNIVDIWDFDEADGRPFYTMDYYFNSLGTIIGESRHPDEPTRIIPLDKAIAFTRQTLLGLARLHHADIIHRDIKPFNLLLTDQECIRICDFGLSKLRGETFPGPPHLKVGSAWYASPEQEQDAEHVDVRADLYSTGIILYRMLTGNLPSSGSMLPSRVNPDLDESWDEFIVRSVEAEPSRRFASADAMLAGLERLDCAWQQRKERICALSQPQPRHQETRRRHPRHHPVKTDPRHGKAVFGLDELWRPLEYRQSEFRAETAELIADAATGLTWQRSGSVYHLTWREAHRYIAHLNTRQFAGLRQWRLPTVDELISLLREVPHGADLCIAPIFELKQRSLWSADRRSFTAAWFVNVELGFVGGQDCSAYHYVRAVCHSQSPGGFVRSIKSGYS